MEDGGENAGWEARLSVARGPAPAAAAARHDRFDVRPSRALPFMHTTAPPIPQPLIERLRGARAVAVLTGAGVSAESGVPTFRDAQTGLWAKYDPQQLATPSAFARNPKFVWDWYAWRRERVGEAKPNPGHAALAAMERHVRDFVLITQNVDGLHRAAGSTSVVELHGNIRRVRCSRGCGVVTAWQDAGDDEPPRCAACGAFLRPDVVWFEEMLPIAALEQAEEAAARCQLLLVVGTSAEVYPAAALPDTARRHGAIVVEVNPQPTPLSPAADYLLRGPSGVVLPALVAATWPDAQVVPGGFAGRPSSLAGGSGDR
jgi:NAD-dependent deacetylase